MSLSFTNINYIRTILPFQLREKNKYHNNLQAYVTLYWWSQVWLLSLPCNYIVISNFQIKYIEIPFNLIGKTLLDADHIIKRYQNFINSFSVWIKVLLFTEWYWRHMSHDVAWLKIERKDHEKQHLQVTNKHQEVVYGSKLSSPWHSSIRPQFLALDCKNTRRQVNE